MLDTLKIKIFTIIMAFITGAGALYYLYTVQQSKPVETTTIVAAADIPTGTKITESMLMEQPVYVPDLMPSAIRSTDQLVGMYATGYIANGAQFAPAMISDQTASSDAKSFSYKIPQGMRTVTIQIAATSSVAGMLQVGDHVDILATYSKAGGENGGGNVTKYIADNIEIAALDQMVVRQEDVKSSDKDDSSSQSTQSYATVTLFTDPDLAKQLIWLQQNGSIVLTLRSPDETENPSHDDFGAKQME